MNLEKVVKLKNAIIEIFNLGQAVEEVKDTEQEFLEIVNKAHREWQIALNNFNYCSDSDMIDYAVYNIDAAEKKFTYLITKAKKENIISPQYCLDESTDSPVNNDPKGGES